MYFKSYRIISAKSRCRIATIIINNSYRYSTIVVERDLIIINIEINDEKFIMVNTYVPPSAPIEDMINKIEFYITKYLNSKTILVGDFNVKHSLWGKST